MSVSKWIVAGLLTFVGVGAYAPRAVSLDVDVLSRGRGPGPLRLLVRVAGAGEQSGRAALAEDGRLSRRCRPRCRSWPSRPAARRHAACPRCCRAAGPPVRDVRNYTLTGACGIPADARAISLNATITNPTGPGFGPGPRRGDAWLSTLHFLAMETVANAAIVPLSSDGSVSVVLAYGSDVILDTTAIIRRSGS